MVDRDKIEGLLRAGIHTELEDFQTFVDHIMAFLR
jgi:hypothetical protein